MNEALPLIKWLASAGGTAVAFFCVWLVYSGRLILRRELDLQVKLLADMTKDRDEWKTVAIKGMNNNERLAGSTERAVATAAIAVTANPQMGNPNER